MELKKRMSILAAIMSTGLIASMLLALL